MNSKLIGLVFLFNSVFAQQNDIFFLQHLYRNGLWREALAYKIPNNITESQADTIKFWKAKILFSQRQYDSASRYYGLVSPSNPVLYFESRHWHNFIELANGQLYQKTWPMGYDSASQKLSRFNFMCNLFLINNLDSLRQNSIKSIPLHSLYEARLRFKQKSGFVAGSLSAVFPGLGKIYAGYPYEGLTAFGQCLVLGLQTVEAYSLNPKVSRNERFWFFGGVFAVFYVGNIWGSSLKIKIRRREFYEQQNRLVFRLMYDSMDKYFNGSR